MAWGCSLREPGFALGPGAEALTAQGPFWDSRKAGRKAWRQAHT